MKLPCLVAMLWATTAFGQDLEVRGNVTDSEGAAVEGATVRVMAEETRLTLRRCRTDEYGRFDFGTIPRGKYLLATNAPGFRERLLALETRRTGVERIGIRLSVVGCDAPGTNCDVFTTGPYSEPNPIRAKGRIRLRPSEGVDLDIGKVTPSKNGADVELQDRGTKGLYFAPLNRARIAQLGAANADCTRGRYERQPVRIDGLGPGADICVVTNGGGRSQLFITEEIVATSDEVRLFYVTRRR